MKSDHKNKILLKDVYNYDNFSYVKDYDTFIKEGSPVQLKNAMSVDNESNIVNLHR